jgi:hypothetical protein
MLEGIRNYAARVLDLVDWMLSRTLLATGGR